MKIYEKKLTHQISKLEEEIARLHQLMRRKEKQIETLKATLAQFNVIVVDSFFPQGELSTKRKA